MPDYTVTTTRYQNLTTQNLTTLQSYILAEEQTYGGTGDFSWIISGISLASRAIADKVRRARIDDVIGALESDNVHGETQQKLDIIANEFIMRCLGERADIGVLASEEGETPTIIRTRSEGGKYCVLFDPLDGSSNIDVGVGVGTIFSILRNEKEVFSDPEELILQRGTKQVAAGYILYGSSVIFVLTTGHGVDMFVLDTNLGTFVQVASKINMPAANKTYSINEAYYDKFPEEYKNYLHWAHENGYSGRYIGSMVADVHRTLLKGGVFLYPPTGVHRKGKLRLMYEANPMGFIMEQAGGLAFADTKRIMEIEPEALHQRCSVIMGSKEEVERVLGFLNGA